jgi:curved DNA-binding protein CbpA
MPRDYYRILDVPNGASLSDIKKAYRQKAKEYHPDKNTHPRAEEAFVLVNEAYEYLKDPVRRASIDKQRFSEYSQQRRKEEHKAWVTQEQARARKRAAQHAEASFEDFSHSPIYKTAAVLNEVYNYVFVGIGLFMIIMPLIRSFTTAEADSFSTASVIAPMTLGLAFLYGIWYYVLKDED